MTKTFCFLIIYHLKRKNWCWKGRQMISFPICYCIRWTITYRTFILFHIDIHTQIQIVTLKEQLQKFYDSIQNISINDDIFFWFLPFSKDEVKPFTFETFNSAAFLFNLKPLSICNVRFSNVVCRLSLISPVSRNSMQFMLEMPSCLRLRNGNIKTLERRYVILSH